MTTRETRRSGAFLRTRQITPLRECNALPSGTVVLTMEGALPVEYLAPGDRIITRGAGACPLRAILRRDAIVEAVSVTHGSLGHGRPDTDSILPAHQEILLRDWRARALFGAERALVPLSRLCDDVHIRAMGPRQLHLVSLIFDTPQVIYADGLELASDSLPTSPPQSSPIPSRIQGSDHRQT